MKSSPQFVFIPQMSSERSYFLLHKIVQTPCTLLAFGSYHEQIKIGKGRTEISPNEAYMFSCNPFPVPIELSQLTSNLMTNELPFR